MRARRQRRVYNWPPDPIVSALACAADGDTLLAGEPGDDYQANRAAELSWRAITEADYCDADLEQEEG